ncbi:MAG: DUF975 family protein [Clostridia bacterium]|nr:DUF975 family protein [Clostridia bacterium]
MWNRKELKEKAKIAFKANYWKTVLVSFILVIVGGGAGYVTFSNNSASTNDVTTQVNGFSQGELLAILLAVLGGIALIGTVMFVVKLLLLNPLSVGCQKFFKENAEFPADLNEIGAGFREKYGNVVLTIFLQNLFLALWTMLFIIPGIVKSYSYRMVPFILADNPEMSSTDIITKSREMMNGHKWDAFVLDLSFLGWLILSGMTAGILAVFYVDPYIFQTNAELYLALKGE